MGKRQKLLNELAIALQGARLMNEDFVWDAYRDRLRAAAIQLVRRRSDDEIKYEKRLRIAMLELHTEADDQT